MANRNSSFTTIRTEGGLLPADLLQKISVSDKSIDGLSLESYHLNPNERINEAASRSWNPVVNAWTAFRDAAEKLPESDRGTSITRERWMLILFQELGYGRLETSKAAEINGRIFPISHKWKNSPIHLVGFRIDIDKRAAGIAGAARTSPHGLVQEFLNSSDKHLWGFVSNGYRLRVLRDNVSLTRQAYVEFDLEAMMDGEVYSDFVMLWLLCHQSRVEADKPENCWLEKWVQTSKEQGTRALDSLRNGVENSIKSLGSGFLSHKDNSVLREKLRSGELSTQDYYRQLLRMVYRLIFLFVAEDRELLISEGASDDSRKVYRDHYSATRLRRLAEKMRGTKHADLYHGLRVVMNKLSGDSDCTELGIPALGSFLWSSEAIPDLLESQLSNTFLLEATRNLSFMTEGKIWRAIDYKNLGSEELGSVYESLLELHPDLHLEAGTFELKTASGHERKTTGSYYTPASLIQCLLNSALDPVIDEAVKKENPEKALLDLKVCDPACGSGHFLIAASHRLSKRLASVRTGDDEPSPEAVRTSLRDVIGHCIYGVDINPMSVELCKVALWMEALEPGKPLSFLDHRILCGNSLLGTTPKLLKDGIPDNAFKPIEGDDKSYCQKYKKLNKDEKKGQYGLFEKSQEPWEQLGNLATAMVNIDGINDNDIKGIKGKEKKYADFVKSTGYLFGRFLADTWCSSFVWKKMESSELAYPITEEVFRRIEKTPHSAPPWMKEEAGRLSKQYQFFHWHLMFPDVFRVLKQDEEPENEQTGWSGGFDVVLGNPPWERIKLQEKEWFAEKMPDIANAPNAAVRRRMIADLRTEEPALYLAFLEDKRKADGESCLIGKTEKYPLCARGDINTYGIFAELFKNIIKPSGRVGCIVPSGIGTDDNSQFFFRHVIETRTLVSFFDFENRLGIFPGVHRSYKFCLLTLCGTEIKAVESPKFVFFALNVDELRDSNKNIRMSSDSIKMINPITMTCPVFRSTKDYEIAMTAFEHCVFMSEEHQVRTEVIDVKLRVDNTKDSKYFVDGDVANQCEILPLYEGKMIHQFNHRYATWNGNNYEYLDEKVRDPSIIAQAQFHIEKEFAKAKYDKLSKWYIAIRRLARSTDERTIISCILPMSCPAYSFNTFNFHEANKNLFYLGCLNSFIFDYLARQKLGGANVTWIFTKQLPLIRFESHNYFNDLIINSVLELTFTGYDLSHFARMAGYEGSPFQWDEKRRYLIRCELDATFFLLYKIERNDVDYIMETFPIVKRKDEDKYGEYSTKRVILEIYDEMAEAMQTGKPYQTRLDPPPADPRVAHPPKEGDEYKTAEPVKEYLKVAEDKKPYQQSSLYTPNTKTSPKQNDKVPTDPNTWLRLSKWVKDEMKIYTGWADFALEISSTLKKGSKPTDKQKSKMKQCWNQAFKAGFMS